MSRTRSDGFSIAERGDGVTPTQSADSGIVAGVRITHDTTTDGDSRSGYHVDQKASVTELLASEDVREAFVLQTCQRVEAYVVTHTASVGQRVLAEFTPDVSSHSVTEMDHAESLRHLLRVAAGLESVILGEDQILGQIRDAYTDARDTGAIGPLLDAVVWKAIHVGERVRTETAINDGLTSVGGATVSLTADRRTLDGATVVVIGAGEVGSVVANAFADSNIERLIIANRSVRRAEHLADDVALDDTRGVGLEGLSAAVSQADVVVSATSSDDYLIDADHLRGSGDTLVIDHARPPDVSPDVATMDDVTLLDWDDLESVLEESKQRRWNSVESVETMIDAELDRLQEQYRRARADEVIAAMYRRAEEIKTREVSTALSRLEARGDVSDAEREIITSLADALVSHLLAGPTSRLREAADDGDRTTLENTYQLFVP